MTEKEATNFRQTSKVDVKLTIALRQLATEEIYSSLIINGWLDEPSCVNFFLLSAQSSLREEYLICPSTSVEWRQIKKFQNTWNVPHAVGSIDGKHITKNKPPDLEVNFTITRRIPNRCTMYPLQVEKRQRMVPWSFHKLNLWWKEGAL